MGDFYYPDINRVSLRADNVGYKFLKLLSDCYLEQHAHLPTRKDYVSDLVLTTSELHLLDDIKTLAPVGNSDHNVLMWSIDCYSNRTNNAY